jgi:TetR/AcrR family transcriptional regulator, fatty acid metabolism regulator protein
MDNLCKITYIIRIILEKHSQCKLIGDKMNNNLRKEEAPSSSKAALRKEHIMNSAEKVFAQKGYQEATISDVAREASLSDTTIYEYFSTKEELLFSIPIATTRKFKELIEFNLKSVRDAGSRIRAFIYFTISFYMSHPHYASMYLLNLKHNRKFSETEACGIIGSIFDLLVDVIEEGIESGDIKRGINPSLLRSGILGTIEHIVIRWLLIDRDDDLLEYADQIYDMAMLGAGKSHRSTGLKLRVVSENEGRAGDIKKAK